MSHTTTEYRLEGDNSIYAQADGKVVPPVVTRAGAEDTNTAQSGDCIRVSGVSIQHTPATKIWFGQVSNTPPATAHFRTTTVRQRPVATCSAATAGSTSARTTQSSST